MPETNIKNVRDLILHTQEVKSLTQKSRQSDELQQLLCRLLPSMLADYCQVRSYERGVLTLGAATGAAATQLRFLAPQILPKLKKYKYFNDLEKISIRIQAASPVLHQHKTRALEPVSQANRQLLKETADSLSDPQLAESLRRLAMTLGNYGKD